MANSHVKSSTEFSAAVTALSTLAVTGASTLTGAVAASTSIAVGGGTAVTKILSGACTVDLASIADNDVGEVTVTVTGAVADDIVLLIPPTAGLTAGLIVGGAVVSAADTVKLRVANLSGGAIDEASSAAWRYILIRV